MGINLNDVPDSVDSEWVTDLGEFLFQVASYELGKSKLKGTPQCTYMLHRVSDGAKMRLTFYDTPKAYPRLKKFVSRCGMAESEMADFHWEDTVGKQLYCTVEAPEKDDKYPSIKFGFRSVTGQPSASEGPSVQPEAEWNPNQNDDLPF